MKRSAIIELLRLGNGQVREDGEWVEDKAGHGFVSMKEVVGPQEVRDVCQTLEL